MLIRFEVANFRSILEPAELSMVAIDRDRPEAREASSLGESLLPVAGVYGPNASGKSNVLAALAWLQSAVRDSLRLWEDTIPVQPFAFAEGVKRSSEFTIELLIDGVRFEYAVELDRNAVRYEGLFHFPEKKRRRILEREDGDLKLQRGLGHLAGTRELLTERTLALSAARRFNEPLVSDFAGELLAALIRGQGTLGRLLHPIHGFGRPTDSWFDDPTVRGGTKHPGADDDRAQALALLQLADLGVDDVRIDDLVEISSSGETHRRRELRLMHRTATGRTPLDFAAESEGTQSWFSLIGPVLTVLRAGSMLILDELEASLHPTLCAELIRLYHDPATNPKGAQLIFTSHDTSLLNHLNRDEVWLTEKDEHGVSRLGALAEFAGERVRRSQNLERAYLHGRFGALPDVERTDMLRALGLIR